MDQRTFLITFIVLALAAVFLFLVRRRDRGIIPEDRLPEALHEPLDGRSGADPKPFAGEGHGVASGAAAAVEDVVGNMLGVEAHRDEVAHPAPTGPGDDLTRLKGVGPKVATLLRELGVTHYGQIAEWTDDDVAAIDERLGAFRGRIMRDRWIDQARLLAKGDTAGFEARFGALGG